MEQMFYNLNLRTVILQGEHYLKTRKKKSRMASQGFLFSMYIKAIVSVQVAVFQALRFKFCSM